MDRTSPQHAWLSGLCAHFYVWTHSDVLEPFAITDDVLIELVKNTNQPDILNVRMICEKNITENEDNDGNDDNSTNSE